VDDPNFGARFDPPETPASVFEADLAERGFRTDQMTAWRSGSALVEELGGCSPHGTQVD
jgi:hypothetical protein